MGLIIGTWLRWGPGSDELDGLRLDVTYHFYDLVAGNAWEFLHSPGDQEFDQLLFLSEFGPGINGLGLVGFGMQPEDLSGSGLGRQEVYSGGVAGSLEKAVVQELAMNGGGYLEEVAESILASEVDGKGAVRSEAVSDIGPHL